MRELTFDGLSPDGSRLVLAGKDGQRYTVEIDERLAAAVRRDRARIGQVEIEQSGQLRPREIQARIRAGATAEDVAAASGLPLEHIRRFEGPVLTERAWVAQQAQATEVRRPGGDIELGDMVAERLQAAGVDPADIAWDAWRRDDGLWVVIATFPMPPNVHMATWTYDSSSRTMTVADDNARELSAITSEQPLRLAPARPLLAAVPVVDADESDDEDEGVAILTPMPSRDAAEDRDDDADDDALPDLEDLTVAEELSEDDDAREAAPAPWGLRLAEEAGDAEEAGQRVEDAEHPDLGADEAADDEPGDADDALPDLEDLTVAEADLDSDQRDAQPAQDEQEPADDHPAPTSDAQDVPLFEAPRPKPQPRPGARKAVPSFDDILFGPGPAPKD
ncbi:MAG TPA: septation protein SepH [Candidatus Nanopelagicales bacterium]